MDFRPILMIVGTLLATLALVMCVPAVVDAFQGNPDWEVFAASAGVTLFLGVAMALTATTGGVRSLTVRQAFVMTTLSWVALTVFASFPFMFSERDLSFTDAFFEAMSGLTTTGSTILTDLDTLPPGILLWRALLQWLGGIGIIVMAIAILPMLKVGGMQLFKIESSDTSEEKIFTALRTVVALFTIYAGLTVLCAVLYEVFGMTPFDAATHAMTTLSTGGYSTHDESFAYFKDARLHWIATAFMIAGSIPFMLYIKTVRGNLSALGNDQQVRGFLGFLVLASLGMAVWLAMERNIDFFEALTLTAFNITSVVTTTGFASDDYTAWGPGAVGMFLVLMFVGGCSGSTSGAIKIYRHQILLLLVRAHIKRLFSPNRVIPLRYNGKPLPQDVPYSVLSFMAVFVATIAGFTVLLSLLGLDIQTAYSASITAVTNVGPGIGDIIGPAGNFASLPVAAKWLLTVAMLAGRLEILALLVAFDPDFWRA